METNQKMKCLLVQEFPESNVSLVSFRLMTPRKENLSGIKVTRLQVRTGVPSEFIKDKYYSVDVILKPK